MPRVRAGALRVARGSDLRPLRRRRLAAATGSALSSAGPRRVGAPSRLALVGEPSASRRDSTITARSSGWPFNQRPLGCGASTTGTSTGGRARRQPACALSRPCAARHGLSFSRGRRGRRGEDRPQARRKTAQRRDQFEAASRHVDVADDEPEVSARCCCNRPGRWVAGRHREPGVAETGRDPLARLRVVVDEEIRAVSEDVKRRRRFVFTPCVA